MSDEQDTPLEVKTNTWHYHNYSAWLEHSTSLKALELQPQIYARYSAYEREFLGDHWGDGFFTEETTTPVGNKQYTVYKKPTRQANFCTYFWAAVLRGPFWRVMTWYGRHEILAFISVILAIILITGTVVGLADPDTSFLQAYLRVGTGVTIAIVAFGVIVYLLYYIKDNLVPKFIEWRYLKEDDKPKKEPEPNIFVEQIKAKKRKVCPMVKFVDDET